MTEAYKALLELDLLNSELGHIMPPDDPRIGTLDDIRKRIYATIERTRQSLPAIQKGWERAQ